MPTYLLDSAILRLLAFFFEAYKKMTSEKVFPCPGTQEQLRCPHPLYNDRKRKLSCTQFEKKRINKEPNVRKWSFICSKKIVNLILNPLQLEKKETFKMPSSSFQNPVSRKRKLLCEVENWKWRQNQNISQLNMC